jgi:hypothetical protein
VDTSYRGEALATIEGSVQTGTAPITTTSIDAAITWAHATFSPDQQLIQSVDWVDEATPVSGTFPANFTLSIYQPPPSSVLIACPGSSAHLAVGFVVAVDATAPVSNANLDSAIVGVAKNNVVLYLDTNEPVGWSCAPDFGFTFAPQKGFHLLEEVPNSVEARYGGAKYPAYVEASQGLATPVSVTLGASPPHLPASCTSKCEAKAASCGAPSAAANDQCAWFCAGAPIQSEIDCLQASDCAALAQSFAAGSVCGVGGVMLPPSSPDAGTP